MDAIRGLERQVRKTAFLLMSLITLYLAAMYRHPPLMLLAVAELAAFFLLFFLALRTACGIRLSFVQQDIVVHRGKSDGILQVGGGIIQSSHLYLQMQLEYVGTERTDQKNSIFFYQDIELIKRGQTLDFFFEASYCGLAHLRVKKLWICDSLGLFRVGRPQKLQRELLVLPGEEILQIGLLFGEGQGQQETVEILEQTGEGDGDFRQNRIYQRGDRIRRIHWNLSARMDQLWVREQGGEPDSKVELLLDMREFDRLSLPCRDAFYRLLSALILGLLPTVSRVEVHWYDRRSSNLQKSVMNGKEDCRELLLELYRAYATIDRESEKQEPVKWGPEESSCLRLTADLKLYWKGESVSQFHCENLQEEMEEWDILLK